MTRAPEQMKQEAPPLEPQAALGRFERVQFTYKTLGGVDFEVAVIAPKTVVASAAKQDSPLLVHFHGGGLVMGTVLEPFFISLWPLELAENHNAVIISPSYRLMPEANGADILDDLKDFWAWVHKDLVALVKSKWSHITINLDKIAVWGESAGGYLALQSAFLFPEANIKAVMPQYCCMYTDLVEYQNGAVDDPEAHALLDEFVAALKPGSVRVSSPFPENLNLVLAINKTRRHLELFGSDERLSLGHALQVAEKIPPIWVMQGTEDRLIKKEAVDEMVARIREAHPETPLLYSVQRGDHGFDTDHGLTEPYIAEGVEFIHKFWP